MAKASTLTETPNSDEPDTAPNDTPDFMLELVDEIPPSQRTGGSKERNTKLKRFYAALSAQPVGAKARFATGVYSPNYGGDNAKNRFPLVKFSARQTGVEKGTGKDGADRKVYDIYATRVDDGPTDSIV